MSWGSSFFLMNVQLFQYNLLKRILFVHWVDLTPLSKISWPYMCATAAAAYVWAYLFILSSNLLKDKLKYSKIWKSLFEQIFIHIGQHQPKWLGALYKQELCTKAFIEHAAAAAAKSLQLCPTLCDPIHGSPPGSAVPGILQARTLEWVAISFSSVWKWKVKVKSLSRAYTEAKQGNYLICYNLSSCLIWLFVIGCSLVSIS